MKKILSLIILAVMLCAFIAGCTEQPATTTAETATAPDTTVPATDTETVPETETETEEVTTEVTTEEETEPEETLPVVTEDEEAMKAEPAETFTVSRAFANGMILQRNEYIRIWGWADDSQNGKRVEAEFSGLHGAAVIENGEWTITLGGTLPECTEGKTLRVYGADGGKEYKYDDVLVGDVYWVIGQSNIWYPVSYILEEPKASEEARNVEINNDLQIRLNRTYAGDFGGITIGTNKVSRDVVNRRGWQKPEEGAKDFSALGYFTALMLYNKMDRKVPIAMIEFDGNGCALHAFLPNEVRDELGISTVNASGVYTAPGVNGHVSSFMYNHGMYAFQKMPIKGILWYQGESDCQDTNNNNTAYAYRFTKLIEYLRNAHDQIHRDYPVYIVELPPIYIAFDFAQVRMNMGGIPNMLENAHICPTSDRWKDKNYGLNEPVKNTLHPYNKYEIAQRMTTIILADMKVEGKTAEVEGPVAVSCEFSEDRMSATIKFKNVADGLKTSGSAAKGIKVISGSRKTWTNASSIEIIDKDTVKITAKNTINSIGYGSAYSDSFPEKLTICSSTGIPACAFRFDYVE